MFTKHLHIHPRKNALWREGPGEGGDGKKGISESKEQEKEKAKKWGLEVTSRIFPKVLPAGKTPEILLKEEIAKLIGIDTKKGPYSVIIAEIRIFMGDIYDDAKNQYKPNSSDGIDKVRYAISDGKESTKKSIDNLAKDAEKFKQKYPIKEFTQKVFDDTVKHPFISKTWIFLNEYKNLKEKVTTLGKLIGPEYGAVIKTAENIMGSKEFGSNTGKIDELRKRLEGKTEESDAFQRNMQTCLEQAGIEKRVFSFDDFNDRFNENRLLNEAEKKFISDYIDGVKKDTQNQPSKEAKKQRLQAFIETNRNSNKLKANQRKAIINALQLLQSQVQQGTDGGWFENAKDVLSGRKDDREKANEEATKKTISTGKRHFVGVTDGKFRVISIEELRGDMENDVSKSVNIGAFSGLLGVTEWKEILIKEFGEKAIASVGAYIQQNPTTRLFAGENAKAKDFFIQEYKKTVEYQQRLLNEQSDKLHGNFNDLFPSLKNHPKITPEIQELIKGKKIAEVYNKLAVSGATNGDIKQIMDAIEKDAKSLKEKGLIEISKQEIQFKGKRWSEFKNDFDLKNEVDQKEFEKLASMQILGLNPEKRAFLLRIVRKETTIGRYIISLSNTINAADTQGQSHIGGKEAGHHPRMAKATPLTPRETEVMKVAGQATGDATVLQIVAQQTEKYIDGMRELRTDDDKLRKLSELQSIKLSELSPKQRDLLIALQSWYSAYTKTASSVNTLRQYSGREETASFVRATFGLELSKEESLRYVDSQTFVTKYVAEKKFVDTVELNTAKMNMRDTQSIGELYNQKGQIDVSKMSEGTGPVSLGETNLITNNTFAGMSELMQCQVSMGTDGNYLTRDILNKSGNIVAKDIPVDNLDTTILQLGRFYAIGLGVLAPYMQHISTAIKSGRTDSVKGTDGTYDLGEDKKFLEIMVITLYGKEALPSEKNIPNLIRLFHSADPAKNPIKKLRDAEIIDESKQVNTTILGDRISKASSTVL